MCTVVFLRRPDHQWPLILGSNRDEKSDRQWQPPGRHWPDRENVVAGLDELAGGSWLGVNDEGVVAGILNRKGSLGPDEKFRSRGELVLEALDHCDAIYAVEAMAELNSSAYRSFNMFIADNRDAWWLRSMGPTGKKVDIFEIPNGFSMLTASDLNSNDSARNKFHLPNFRRANSPDPEANDWQSWKELMNSKDHAPGESFSESMLIDINQGFGTLSTSLIALETSEVNKPRKKWQFLDQSITESEYIDIEI